MVSDTDDTFLMELNAPKIMNQFLAVNVSPVVGSGVSVHKVPVDYFIGFLFARHGVKSVMQFLFRNRNRNVLSGQWLLHMEGCASKNDKDVALPVFAHWHRAQ